MEIEVQLFAFLRHYLPKGTKGFTCKMQLDEPTTVRAVFKELKMPDEVMRTITILRVNGVNAEMDQILSDGDVLTVLPVAAGG